jgi:hypothetical protein
MISNNYHDLCYDKKIQYLTRLIDTQIEHINHEEVRHPVKTKLHKKTGSSKGKHPKPTHHTTDSDPHPHVIGTANDDTSPIPVKPSTQSKHNTENKTDSPDKPTKPHKFHKSQKSHKSHKLHKSHKSHKQAHKLGTLHNQTEHLKPTSTSKPQLSSPSKSGGFSKSSCTGDDALMDIKQCINMIYQNLKNTDNDFISCLSKTDKLDKVGGCITKAAHNIEQLQQKIAKGGSCNIKGCDLTQLDLSNKKCVLQITTPGEIKKCIKSHLFDKPTIKHHKKSHKKKKKKKGEDTIIIPPAYTGAGAGGFGSSGYGGYGGFGGLPILDIKG